MIDLVKMLFTILAESYEVWPSRRKVLLASVACRLAARAVGETRLGRKDRSVRNGGHPCRCHQMDLMERTSTTQRRDGSALRQPRPAWALSLADEVEPRLSSAPHSYATDRLSLVLSGTWWVNSGDDFDPDNTVPVSASGFVRRVAHAAL